MIPGVWQGISPGLAQVGQSVVTWGVDQFGVQSPRIGTGMARMLDSTVAQIGGAGGSITGAQDRTGGQVAQGSGQIAGAELGAGGQVAGATLGSGGQIAGAEIGGSSMEAGAQMAGSGQVAGATLGAGGVVAGAVDRVGPSIQRASTGITIGAGQAVGGEVSAASPAFLTYKPGKPKGAGFFEQILVSTVEQSLHRSPELFNIFMDQAKLHIARKTIKPDMFKTPEVKDAVDKFLKEMEKSPTTMADFFMMLIELPGKIFTDILYGILTPEPPLTLDKARKSQSRYVGIIFDVNLLVGIIDLVIEAISLGQVEGIGRVMSNMIWSMGLGQVPQYTVAPLLERAVVRPLEYYFNETLTPEIPDTRDLIQAVVRDVINYSQFEAIMPKRGLSKEWAKVIWDSHYLPPDRREIFRCLAAGVILPEERDHYMHIVADLDPRYDKVWNWIQYRDPGRFEVRFMFETGDLDEKGVEEYLRRLMYREKDLKALTGYVTHFQERLWRRRYLLTLATGYRLGKVDAARLEKEVLEAKYTKGVAYWIKMNEDLRKELRTPEDVEPLERALTKAQIQDLWTFGIHDEPWFELALEEIGYTPEEVEDLKGLTRIDLIKDERNRLRSEYEKWYIDGWLSMDKLKANLAELLYSGDEIDLYAASAELHALRDHQDKLASILEKQFKAGKIEEEDFRVECRRIGRTEEAIEKAVERILLEREPPPIPVLPTLTKSEILKAFREGHMDEKEARDRLAAMKYPPEVIDYYIEMNRPEVPVEIFPTLTKAEVLSAYRTGRMEEEEAILRLQKMGYSLDDIYIYLLMNKPEAA
jgi:hypothetical protein